MSNLWGSTQNFRCLTRFQLRNIHSKIGVTFPPWVTLTCMSSEEVFFYYYSVFRWWRGEGGSWMCLRCTVCLDMVYWLWYEIEMCMLYVLCELWYGTHIWDRVENNMLMRWLNIFRFIDELLEFGVTYKQLLHPPFSVLRNKIKLFFGFARYYLTLCWKPKRRKRKEIIFKSTFSHSHFYSPFFCLTLVYVFVI